MNPFRYVTALLGFLAAILAIARDDRNIVWVAITFLGASLGVRVIQKIQQRRQRDDPGSNEPDR